MEAAPPPGMSAADRALEDRALRRLELEEVRQKRVMLELELEARRRATEAAQQKLAELAGEGAGASVPAALPPRHGADGQAARGAQAHELEPEASQSHAIINERLAQRRREREMQHQDASRKLDDLNAQRWKLQQEQLELQKAKAAAAAEAARDQAEAAYMARQVEETLSVKPLPPRQSLSAEDEGAMLVAAEEANKARRSKGVVDVHVQAPAEVAKRVGEAIPLASELIEELTREREDTLHQAQHPASLVPEFEDLYGEEHVVSHVSVAAHQQRWEEAGAALNRALRKEAFEKAIRKQMNKLIDEVVMVVVSDVSAECSFARFWAEQTAGSFLVEALLSQDGGPRANTTLSAKQKRDKTNALMQILGDYRRRRSKKETMHVHTLPTVHPESLAAHEGAAHKHKAGKPDTAEVIEADKLLLYMDMPNMPPEEKVKQLLTRERSHWRKIEALPLFLTGLPEGVERSAPSHDANQLAVTFVKSSGLCVYDIRHLPFRPSRKRAGWGARIMDMAWSADSTNLVTLDSQSNVVVWSIRVDKEQKGSIFSKSGEQIVLPLVQIAAFLPLFNMTAKPTPALQAQDLARLVDISTPSNYLGSAVKFHACITAGGRQPSIMMGLQGGMLLKLNTTLTDRVVFAPCAVEPAAADVREGGGGGPVAQDSGTPLREYFVRHMSRVILIAPVFSGAEMVSMDEDGLVCVWRYNERAFSSMGWFVPERVLQVIAADAVFQDQAEDPPKTLFPHWFKGQGPDFETDRLAFKEEARKHVETLQAEWESGQGDFNPAKPFEATKWEEHTFAGRRKEGVKELHKGQDIDHVSGKCYFHTLRYTDDRVLLSHVMRIRTRSVTRGFVLRALVDYTGKRVVMLCYLPPGGPKRHGHLATILRVDLRDPISLLPPRIDTELPKDMQKAMDKINKKFGAQAGVSTRELQSALRKALDGIDFDIAPPQARTGVHVAHLLLGNKIYTYSLESGEELMEPLDPLAAQKRRGTLSSVRCVAKFDLPHGTDPFTAPSEAGLDDNINDSAPASFEHLVIATTRDAPTVYMYSFERPGWRDSSQGAQVPSTGSSRVPSRGIEIPIRATARKDRPGDGVG